MTRDYKNSNRKPKKKPVPGWVWLLTGLLIGLMVALLVYLSGQSGSGAGKIVTKPPVKKSVAKTPKKKPVNNDGLRYEFYTVLPESEIVIPEDDINARDPEGAARVKTGQRYVLQAGSFRKQTEADSLRARLALLGIESGIENVVVNGDTWHRVRLGPYNSIRDVNSTRNLLARNNVNAILIKLKNKR